jgi:hypothetical protein
MNIEPLCPATGFDGLAIARLPPRVTVKLQLVAKSGVIVAPSVSVVIVGARTPSMLSVAVNSPSDVTANPLYIDLTILAIVTPQ